MRKEVEIKHKENETEKDRNYLDEQWDNLCDWNQS